MKSSLQKQFNSRAYTSISTNRTHALQIDPEAPSDRSQRELRGGMGVCRFADTFWASKGQKTAICTSSTYTLQYPRIERKATGSTSRRGSIELIESYATGLVWFIDNKYWWRWPRKTFSPNVNSIQFNSIRLFSQKHQSCFKRKSENTFQKIKQIAPKCVE